ncbi:cytochrome P450 [Boletus edulis BED1]|uniref:Cytochrome P450 n=1 Tax=Boletus edulis BED1 TaxID=1328754 RepID=A0AAD4BAZ6_BOLED|nr:cytochrome P450 [Boletus edulis BED1]
MYDLRAEMVLSSYPCRWYSSLIIIDSEKIAITILIVVTSSPTTYFNSALMPYEDTWRFHRRFLYQTFRGDAVQRFLPFQHRKACQFLRQLFNTPTQLDKHVFEYTSSVVLKSTYDYDPPSQDDELIKIVVKVHEIALSVVRPDVAIGICCHFPDNPEAPGLVSGDVETTFEYSLQRIEGLGSHTFFHVSTQHSLKRNCSIAPSMEAKGTFDRYSLAFLLVMFASPASEKSHSVLMTFFLMIVLNLAVQEKAQVEIDAVVGRGRLPTMDDRPWLPFIDAIFRETLRYSPAVPSSVPHVAVDDVYRAILMANTWYLNLHSFIPERLLNDDGSLKYNDTKHIAFGFGRLIANVLAVFKILRPLDENGVEIPVEPKFTTRLVVHRRRVDFDPVHRRPLPIQCRIVPRMPGMDGEKLEELIATSD